MGMIRPDDGRYGDLACGVRFCRAGRAVVNSWICMMALKRRRRRGFARRDFHDPSTGGKRMMCLFCKGVLESVLSDVSLMFVF